MVRWPVLFDKNTQHYHMYRNRKHKKKSAVITTWPVNLHQNNLNTLYSICIIVELEQIADREERTARKRESSHIKKLWLVIQRWPPILNCVTRLSISTAVLLICLYANCAVIFKTRLLIWKCQIWILNLPVLFCTLNADWWWLV